MLKLVLLALSIQVLFVGVFGEGNNLKVPRSELAYFATKTNLWANLLRFNDEFNASHSVDVVRIYTEFAYKFPIWWGHVVKFIVAQEFDTLPIRAKIEEILGDKLEWELL